MSHEQDRLGSGPPSSIPRDQAVVPRRQLENPGIRFGQPGSQEAAGHGLGGLVGVAGGIAGVDLDQLLQNLALEGTVVLLSKDGRYRENSENEGESKTHGLDREDVLGAG
jgi:hypothetical protein